MEIQLEVRQVFNDSIVVNPHGRESVVLDNINHDCLNQGSAHTCLGPMFC